MYLCVMNILVFIFSSSKIEPMNVLAWKFSSQIKKINRPPHTSPCNWFRLYRSNDAIRISKFKVYYQSTTPHLYLSTFKDNNIIFKYIVTSHIYWSYDDFFVCLMLVKVRKMDGFQVWTMTEKLIFWSKIFDGKFSWIGASELRQKE